MTRHASIPAPAAPFAEAGPPGATTADSSVTMGQAPLVAALLVPAVVVPLCVALYVVAGAPAALPPTLALAAAMAAWLARWRRAARPGGARRPGGDAGSPPPRPGAPAARAFSMYVAAIVVLIAQAAEAWLAHLPAALTALFPAAYRPGVAFDDHQLVAAFPLTGSVLFLFGALAVHERHPVGEGAAWLLFAWAVASAAAPFAYLAAAGTRPQYLGGMAVAPLAAAVGLRGAWLLWARDGERTGGRA